MYAENAALSRVCGVIIFKKNMIVMQKWRFVYLLVRLKNKDSQVYYHKHDLVTQISLYCTAAVVD